MTPIYTRLAPGSILPYAVAECLHDDWRQSSESTWFCAGCGKERDTKPPTNPLPPLHGQSVDFSVFGADGLLLDQSVPGAAKTVSIIARADGSQELRIEFVVPQIKIHSIKTGAESLTPEQLAELTK